MKLKSLVFVGLLALASSCTNQGNAFYISKFYPIDGCDIEAFRESSFISAGQLDVAAGTPQFFVGVEIIGAQTVSQQPVLLGGTTLEQANRNRPVINRQVITYRYSKRIPGAPTTYEAAYVAPFSDNGEVYSPFQLISPELGQALVDGLSPVDNIADDFVDLTVDLEFRGEFNATRTPFTTGTASLPIRVYKSNVTCATKFRQQAFDPVTMEIDACRYAGQSGRLLSPPEPFCCPAGTTTPGC